MINLWIDVKEYEGLYKISNTGVVLNAIGYGSISVVQNLLHRHDLIKQGPYKGCKIVTTQPVEMVKIINS